MCTLTSLCSSSGRHRWPEKGLAPEPSRSLTRARELIPAFESLQVITQHQLSELRWAVFARAIGSMLPFLWQFIICQLEASSCSLRMDRVCTLQVKALPTEPAWAASASQVQPSRPKQEVLNEYNA